jgi:hypothetical protein
MLRPVPTPLHEQLSIRPPAPPPPSSWISLRCDLGDWSWLVLAEYMDGHYQEAYSSKPGFRSDDPHLSVSASSSTRVNRDLSHCSISF